MSESVKQYIREQFEKARQRDARVAPKITKYEATIEVVQPIAEPTSVRQRPVCYSNQTVYEIPTPKDESLDELYARAIKSLTY